VSGETTPKLQVLHASLQAQELFQGRLRFKLLLHGLEFGFDVATPKVTQAAFGFVPRWRRGGLEHNGKEKPAIRLGERFRESCWIGLGASDGCGEQYFENSLGVEAFVKGFADDLMRKSFAKVFGFDQHLHQPPVRLLHGGGDQLGLRLHFTVALD
jgi:hypothetical protein